MSIVRAPRPESGFYILDKKISEDKRLTWAARGMLVYLLGKPDNWRVSVASLVNETEGSRVQSGRDAVRATLRELMDCGYMVRVPKRSQEGRLDGYEYHVSESPQTDRPATDKAFTESPQPDHPATGKPATANPPQTSIEFETKNECNQELILQPAIAHCADEKATRKPRKAKEPPKTDAIWNAYATAYFERYGTEPVRNAQVNGMLARVMERLPAEEAPHVAAFYVRHNLRYYVQCSHHVKCLLSDCEGLRTQWATNNQVSEHQARSADRMGNFSRQIKQINGNDDEAF